MSSLSRYHTMARWILFHPTKMKRVDSSNSFTTSVAHFRYQKIASLLDKTLSDCPT
jgi:hypothetical protein